MFIRKLRGNLAHWSRSGAIKSYLAAQSTHKLQIGAGPNVLEGWLNTDIVIRANGVIFLDAAKPFPFNDCTFDCIFTEHQIEQLTYNQSLFMLSQCHRILKPGGHIRIATPSLETLLGLRSEDKSEIQEEYIRWITDNYLPDVGVYKDTIVINNAFSLWGHKFLFDYVTLEDSLSATGFIDVTRCDPGESNVEHLRGIDSHGQAVKNERMSKFESLILESTRP